MQATANYWVNGEPSCVGGVYLQHSRGLGRQRDGEQLDLAVAGWGLRHWADRSIQHSRGLDHQMDGEQLDLAVAGWGPRHWVDRSIQHSRGLDHQMDGEQLDLVVAGWGPRHGADGRHAGSADTVGLHHRFRRRHLW